MAITPTLMIIHLDDRIFFFFWLTFFFFFFYLRSFSPLSGCSSFLLECSFIRTIFVSVCSRFVLPLLSSFTFPSLLRRFLFADTILVFVPAFSLSSSFYSSLLLSPRFRVSLAGRIDASSLELFFPPLYSLNSICL